MILDKHSLIDHLLQTLRLKNDAALSRALELAPAIISKIRNRRAPVSAAIMVLIHEATDIPIADIKALIAADEPQPAEQAAA